MILFVSLLCGAWMFGMLFLLLRYLRRSSRATVSRRVRGFSLAEPRREKSLQLQETIRELIRALGAYMQTMRQARKLDLRMQQAGLPLLGSEFQAVLLLSGTAMALFTFFLTLQGGLAMLAFVGGMVLVWGYVSWRISHRRQVFTNQLGDTLGMVANALRAGFSFLQATELIAKEMEAPMGSEFATVMREVRFGTPMEVALQNMGNRVQSSDFDLVVTAVLIQRQVGGNLSQILDTISTTINDRVRMKREIRSLTAQGRFSGWILSILPIVVGIVMYGISPQYLQPLWEENIGRIAVGVGLCMEIVGFLIIQRIVDIDV